MDSDAAGISFTSGVITELAHARAAELFDAHHARLYRLARRLAGSKDEAQDLVQETFLRALRSPSSVPVGAASEEAWLVRVLVNICRDQWRRRASRSNLASRLNTGRTQLASSNAETALVARSTIWTALRALPPRRRAAIVLYELDGVGISDIARLLGVSPITVRWHLSRGRRELAAFIDRKKGGSS